MTRASEAAARAFWPLGNTRLEKRLALIAAPTLVLWGEHDAVLPPSYAKKFAAGINGSTRVANRCRCRPSRLSRPARGGRPGRPGAFRLTPAFDGCRAGPDALLSGRVGVSRGYSHDDPFDQPQRVAAMLVLGASLPAYAQGQVQAVPRAGVSFTNTVTVRAWIESADTETRTVVFTTPDGRLIDVRGRRQRQEPRRDRRGRRGRRHLQRGRDAPEPAPEGPGLARGAQGRRQARVDRHRDRAASPSR